MVRLAEERQQFWSELKEMAGLEQPASVRDALMASLEEEFVTKAAAMTREYEQQIASLKATYPALVARKLAEGLLKSAEGRQLAQSLMASVPASGSPLDVSLEPGGAGVASSAGGTVSPTVAPSSANGSTVTPEYTSATAAGAPAAPAPARSGAVAEKAPAAEASSDDDDLAMESYVESARCTSCNECTNLNKKLFAYDGNKQAYIKDPKAGTFAQLVQAAEKCPVGAIHPGTPLNPKEKDLAKWIERAKPFQ
jgi:ferredoxin